MVDLSILSKSTHLRIGMVKRIKILLTLPFSLLVIIPRCTYIHFIFIKRCVHKAAKEISFVENKNYIPVASSNIREKISTAFKMFLFVYIWIFYKIGSKVHFARVLSWTSSNTSKYTATLPAHLFHRKQSYENMICIHT